MNTISNMNTLNVLRGLAASANEIKKFDDSAVLADTPSGKYERTYNQREACEATGILPRHINNECKSLDIDYRDDGKFCISASDIAKLNNKRQRPFVRKAGSECAVWCVTQQKGGSGKTTVATTIATGLASECFNKLRIGFMDLDPQGTGTMLLKPNFDDSMFSCGDLLTGNYKLGDDETFQSLCSSAFYQTSLPNLRVMCAQNNDRFYETFVERKRTEANKSGTAYSSYKDLNKIIDEVKSEFDIIIIDTSPYFSAATWTAHYAANNIIIPMRPSQNDTDSSVKYLDQLAEVYDILAGIGHTGYENIIIQPSAVGTSVAQIDTVSDMRNTFGEHCSQYDFILSDAILHCGKEKSTIYDLSVSEYAMGSKKSLKRAQIMTRPIIKSIQDKSIAFWGK